MSSFRRRAVCWLALLTVAGAVGLAAGAEGEPVYVGVGVCLSCHAGNAGVPWTATAHARSYLVLGTGYEEMVLGNAHRMVDIGHGREIVEAAERLGQETDCLSCHATAAGATTAQRAETFHLEDGVQCEACHGPGGEHVAQRRAAEIGEDSNVELKRLKATLDGCQRCHRPKPSHAVLETEPFEPAARWKTIAHSRSEP